MFEDTKIQDIDDEWLIMNEGRSGAGQYIGHTIISSEIEGDNIYLYDKYVYCVEDINYVGCYKDLENLSEISVISCQGEDDGTMNEKNCPYSSDGKITELAEYALENMSDKLNTYKHTFKKIDGKYYWYSSEIVK